MATSALKSAPDSLQFDNVGRNREGIKLSQSAMKSVVANIKRGREAITQALLNKSTVHRAMFRQGMGWVDFEWGSEGGKITAKGKRPGAKGIAHIIEARQRKDGLNAKQAESLLFDLVDTIAKGEEINRFEEEQSTRIGILNDRNVVFLAKNKGSNAWVVTGYKQDMPDDVGSGKDAPTSTNSASTLTRSEIGAGNKTITQQDDNSSNNNIKFSRSTPSNTPADNSAMRSFFAPALGKQALGWLAGLFQRNHLIDFVAQDLPELVNYS